MKKINPYGFYTFGQFIQPLFSISAGVKVSDWSQVLLRASSWIDTTINYDSLSLRLCKVSGLLAIEAVNAIASQSPDSTVTLEQANAVITALFDFQAVLQAELNLSDAYIVSPKSLFSTTMLIENGEMMFPEDVRLQLPAEAILDIKQGARCFAFELPTAAGFHFLRAVEAVIHHHYDVLSKNAKRPTRGAMGIYIDELIKLNAMPEIVAALKQIKDLHRNPIAHPDEVLDMSEAQMLMGIIQSAIFAMVKVLPAPSAIAGIPGLLEVP